MEMVVLVEAQPESPHLPGKSLLPICGVPLAILAARRAGSRGRPTILVTPGAAGDVLLADAARRHGIDLHCGTQANALGRAIAALAPYGDTTLVARLSADNVVPDGALIEEVATELLSRDLTYIDTVGAGSGLPLGVDVEITSVRHLRRAHDSVATRGHTHARTDVIRDSGRHTFGKYRNLGRAHFRMTIDCFDDYLSIQRVFSTGENPVDIPWKDLVDRAEAGLFQPAQSGPANRFILGTVQLGAAYGVTGARAGSDAERTEMLKTAIGHGIGGIDTARAYGNSEEVIGAALATGWAGRCPVITKLSPLAGLPPEAPADQVRLAVERDVLRSCIALRVQRLDTLLLHRAEHLNAWGGAGWQRLRELRDEGRIGRLGVSVQSPEEARAALDNPDVQHVQLPCNLLDWRWDTVLPHLQAARASRGMTVHMRSIFLQGLLLSQTPDAWARAHVADPGPALAWLREWSGALNRADMADLCLAWAKQQTWADGLVIGCDTLEQLQQNISRYHAPPLSADQSAGMMASRPRLAPETLDPARWRV